MRPIWKGHISFGLVNVPVTLYPAEQRTDLHLHMIDSRNMSRVRYERVNAETGAEVPWDQIVRGYEYDDGNYVILGEEDLRRAAPEATKTIDIETFVNLSDIDLTYFDKPYYLEPGKNGAKGYVLLRETLDRSGKAGIARVVIRTRQYLAALVARGDALVLNLLRYPQELRSAGDLDLPGSVSDVGVKKAEIDMARTLVESMATDWEPDQYHDEYRETLMKWIEQKAASGEIKESPPMAEEEDAPAPINIMELLKKSVAHSGAKPARSSSRKKQAKAGGSKSKKSAKKTGASKASRKKAG